MCAAWAEIQPTGGSGEVRSLSRYLNSACYKFKRDKPCSTRKILGFYQGPCPQLLRPHLDDTTIFLRSPCLVLHCVVLPCLEQTRLVSIASDALILIEILQWLLHLRVPPCW
jgi:hypothetical protein